MARVSIIGYSARRACRCSSISLLGDTISMNHLIIHISKYIRLGDTSETIHRPLSLRGIIGLMAFSLFHTRAWWQQALRVRVTTVIHDVNTGTVNPKRAAIFFLRVLSAKSISNPLCRSNSTISSGCMKDLSNNNRYDHRGQSY